MLGDRMVRIEVDHRSHDRRGGERVVGRRLDEAVTLRQRRADHGDACGDGHVAGDDVHVAGADGAHTERRCSRPPQLDPPVEVGLADHLVDLAAEAVPVERRGELLVHRPEHTLGHLTRFEREPERRLHQRVLVERKARTQLGKEVDHLVDRRVMEVLQLARIAHDKLGGVLAGVGRPEAGACPATELDGVVTGLDDPPPDDDRDVDDRVGHCLGRGRGQCHLRLRSNSP